MTTQQQPQQTKKLLPHQKENWQGYTLDELRYMRAYSAARIEINRERLNARIGAIQKHGLGGSSRSIMGKVLGAFNYFDIGLIAWQIGSKVFKAAKFLKK